jgi:hypothetical protein
LKLNRFWFLDILCAEYEDYFLRNASALDAVGETDVKTDVNPQAD